MRSSFKPRLAAIYDAFDGERHDLGPYVRIIGELGAKQVIDVGCGTGAFAVLLARGGRTVTAVDPARASLDIAKTKPWAKSVTWIHGDATQLTPLEADAAVMTGNVAQVFLTDQVWSETLGSVRNALREGRLLVFESRRPERRAWEEWATGTAVRSLHVPGSGASSNAGRSRRLPFRMSPSGRHTCSTPTRRFSHQNPHSDSEAANRLNLAWLRPVLARSRSALPPTAQAASSSS